MNLFIVKKTLIYMSFIVFVGCSLSKDVISTVKFPSTNNPEYLMDIPKGYSFNGIQGNSEVEHRYIYPDSSIIFITSFYNTPNYDILREANLYHKKFEAAVAKQDTLVLEGLYQNKYWKDITYGDISIGYVDASKEKKSVYDKALETFRYN